MSTSELLSLLAAEFKDSGIEVVVGNRNDSVITYIPASTSNIVRVSMSGIIRDWVEFSHTSRDDSQFDNFLAEILIDAQAIVLIHNETLRRTGSLSETVNNIVNMQSRPPVESVHDNSVNNTYRVVYQRLCRSVYGLPGTIHEIITACPNPRSYAAVKLIHAINSTIMTVGDTESNILVNIWRRIHCPGNSEVAAFMRDLLFSSLAELVSPSDGVYKFTFTVCANGRFSAIMSAIEVYDYEKILTVMTFPVLRAHIIQNHIPALLNSGTPGSEIEQIIRSEYQDLISPANMDSIMAEVREAL